MTLRDEMLRAIEENIALDMDFGGVVGLNPQGMEDTADAILDLVREALLSDEALQAVIDDIATGDRSLREAMEDRRLQGWTPYSTGAYGTARSYVTAALDAVTGEDDER